MKAAVYYGPEDIRIEQHDDPKCPVGGVLIKVEVVGICGSDVRTYYSGSGKIKPPMILGHEAIGRVVEVDKEHDVFQVDDRIAMAPGIFCRKCYYCEHGMTTMCENLVELAFQFPGGFAEYMPIPGIAFERGRIVAVPQDLSSEYAALCEAASSVIMSQERADIHLGESVVIFGAGPIGCLHIQVARARGAAKIVMVYLGEQRLEMAMVFGADHYINAREENIVETVRGITNNIGADKLIIAAPSALAQKQAVEMCRKRGTVVLFGGLPKENSITQLDGNIIHYSDICVIGHYGQEKRHVQLALDMILRGQINADKLISKILPLDEIVAGFELIKSKNALKVLLKP